MPLRTYRDNLRAAWMCNTDTAPTRSIIYIRQSDAQSFNLEAFVTGEELNKAIAEDKTVNTVIFSGLILEAEPTKLDTIQFSGRSYRVSEWKLLGELYSVIAENDKRNPVTTRRFKSAN